MDTFRELPFEWRCGAAQRYLAGLKADIRTFAGIRPQNTRQLLEPKEGDSPEIKRWKEEWLKEDDQNWTDFEEKLAASEWDWAVKICRSLFGDDATDFALKALEREGDRSAN